MFFIAGVVALPYAFFVQVLHYMYLHLIVLTFVFQITVYKIDDKNNLDLDLAILSALLKGKSESITFEYTYCNTSNIGVGKNK